MTVIRSQLIGTGYKLPAKILTNDDLSKMVETNDEWISTRTGIRSRHIAAEGETTCDLSYDAALTAIENAGIKNSEIDFVIVATVTPDNTFRLPPPNWQNGWNSIRARRPWTSTPPVRGSCMPRRSPTT